MESTTQLPWELLPAQLVAEIEPALAFVNVIDYRPNGGPARELRLTNGELLQAFADQWMKTRSRSVTTTAI